MFVDEALDYGQPQAKGQPLFLGSNAGLKNGRREGGVNTGFVSIISTTARCSYTDERIKSIAWLPVCSAQDSWALLMRFSQTCTKAPRA